MCLYIRVTPYIRSDLVRYAGVMVSHIVKYYRYARVIVSHLVRYGGVMVSHLVKCYTTFSTRRSRVITQAVKFWVEQWLKV